MRDDELDLRAELGQASVGKDAGSNPVHVVVGEHSDGPTLGDSGMNECHAAFQVGQRLVGAEFDLLDRGSVPAPALTNDVEGAALGEIACHGDDAVEHVFGRSGHGR